MGMSLMGISIGDRDRRNLNHDNAVFLDVVWAAAYKPACAAGTPLAGRHCSGAAGAARDGDAAYLGAAGPAGTPQHCSRAAAGTDISAAAADPAAGTPRAGGHHAVHPAAAPAEPDVPSAAGV